MKRAVFVVVILVTFGGVLAFALERTWLARERAAIAWRFEQTTSWRADATLGLLDETAKPQDLVTDAGLTWVSTPDWLASDSRTRRDDETWLRRKLSEVGLVSVPVRMVALPGSTVAQRAVALRTRRHSLLVFAIDASELALELPGSRVELRRPAADESRLEVVPPMAGKGLPSQPEAWPDLLRKVPTIRILYDRPPTLETADGVFFPAWLWPWRRDGAPTEGARYERLRRALEFVAQVAKSAGTRLVCVRYPARFEIDDLCLSRMLGELELDSASFESRRQARRLADLCAELDIPLIEPRDSLRKLATTKPVFEGDRLRARPTQRARRAIFPMVAQRLRRLLD